MGGWDLRRAPEDVPHSEEGGDFHIKGAVTESQPLDTLGLGFFL